MPLLTTIVTPISSKSSEFFTSFFIPVTREGILYTLTGYTTAASMQFIQLYDTTTYRVANLKPLTTVIINPNTNFSIDFPKGLYFKNGIVAINSSSSVLHTSGGSNVYYTAAFA